MVDSNSQKGFTIHGKCVDLVRTPSGHVWAMIIKTCRWHGGIA